MEIERTSALHRGGVAGGDANLPLHQTQTATAGHHVGETSLADFALAVRARDEKGCVANRTFSQDQDCPEIIHVGQGRSGNDLCAGSLKESVAVIVREEPRAIKTC